MAVSKAGMWSVLALAAVAAPTAQAAMQEGWSFEIAIGQARFTDVKTAELDLLPPDFFNQFSLDYDITGSSVRIKDRSYAVITSYRLNENFSMETGFFRLGAFQYSSVGTVDDGVPAGFTMSFRAKGVMFGASYAYPLGEIFELRGRGGISSSDTRLKYTATVQATSVADQFKASSQDFYFGVGIGANVGDYYRVGIDWMRHRDMGKTNLTYRANVDNIMASISYLY